MSNYRRYYENNYYFFITVTTFNRNNILLDNIKLLRNCFKNVKTNYKFEILAMVVLPNHVHLIIKPDIADECPKIIGNIKRSFTKALNKEYLDNDISESRLKRREKGVWQRRFYEHTIRSEEELHKYLNYVHYNPVKHGYVRNVKDWEFSSFMKFVNMGQYDINWGSSDDLNNNIAILMFDD